MTAQRRLEDDEVSILLVEAGASRSVPSVVRYRLDAEQGMQASRPGEAGWHGEASAILLDLAGEPDAILVTNPEFRRIARGAGGGELVDRAALGVAASRRERARALRRLQLPDRLLAFSEELNRAHSAPAVCRALAEHASRIVGGFTAVVYLLEAEEDRVLRPAEHPWLHLALRDSALDADLRFLGPGLVRAEEVLPATGGPFTRLRPLILESGARSVAYVPLGDRGLLLLLERRADRAFEAEDWDLLRSVSRQAEVAFERVSLFERVHTLSLTDPLTGLGNRRKLEVVLEHAFAAARRGQPLSVAMIDLEGFKEFNDTHGHVHGDEVLRSFAAALQEQLRGSDIVVRYGGDEFLFVLSGATAETAHATVERLRQNLASPVRFTAGIAEYEPGINSVDELIDRADQALYAVRRQDPRRLGGPALRLPAAASAPGSAAASAPGSAAASAPGSAASAPGSAATSAPGSTAARAATS